MAGRFEGLSELEWRLCVDIMPPEPTTRGRGMPHTPFRKVVNTLLYLLITGYRWCDTPRGPLWASKSATHRWLQRWQADGILAAMHAQVLGLADVADVVALVSLSLCAHRQGGLIWWSRMKRHKSVSGSQSLSSLCPRS